jgi:hypothetical protein
MDNRTYISERSLSAFIPKIVNGKKVIMLNEFGNPKQPLEYEMHRIDFTPFEVKKNDLGEQVRTYIFIIDANTPKEIESYIHDKLYLGGRECEPIEEYVRRTEPKRFHAIEELKKERDKNRSLSEQLAEAQEKLEKALQKRKKE